MQKSELKILLLQLRKDKVMREHEVRCVLRSGGITSDQLSIVNGLDEELKHKQLQDKHLFIVGGSGDFSVFDDLPFKERLREMFMFCREENFPVLGSCWGGQFLAQVFGGEIASDKSREEVGTFLMKRTRAGAADPLFSDFPDEFYAQLGHHESIIKLPKDAVSLVRSDKCPVQAFTWPGSAQYGLQLHPELGKTDVIERILHYKTSYASNTNSLKKTLEALIESPLTENLIGKFISKIVLPRFA